VDSIPGLKRAAESFKAKILPHLRQSFNIAEEAELGDLRLYVQTLTEGESVPWKRETGYHISFTTALSERLVEYHGGGTDFPMFRLRVHLERGEAISIRYTGAIILILNLVE